MLVDNGFYGAVARLFILPTLLWFNREQLQALKHLPLTLLHIGVACFPARRHLTEQYSNREASQTTSSEKINGGHCFTPQEASKLLPDIRIRIKQLIERRRVIAQLHDELEKYNLLGFTTDEMAEMAAQLDAKVIQWKKMIDEVEDLGVIIRDLEWGVVDFPADRYGKKVMLCWRYGEPEVSYWHSLNESFPDRKLLKAEMIQP